MKIQCPHCKTENSVVLLDRTFVKTGCVPMLQYQLECIDCHMVSARAETNDEALELWTVDDEPKEEYNCNECNKSFREDGIFICTDCWDKSHSPKEEELEKCPLCLELPQRYLDEGGVRISCPRCKFETLLGEIDYALMTWNTLCRKIKEKMK